MRDRIRAYIKFTTIAVIALSFSAYVYIEFKDLLIGPIVEINEPKNGALILDNVALLSGSAKNTNSTTINGRPLLIDENGTFQEKIVLHDGYNSIFIEAKDKIGNTITKTIELISKKGEKKASAFFGTTTTQY